MKIKKSFSKLILTVLSTVVFVGAISLTAFADDELTHVDDQDTASSVTAVSYSSSGIESAAVGSESAGTSSTANSGVITAGSTNTTSSNVVAANTTTTTSNVVVAGSTSRSSGPASGSGGSSSGSGVTGYSIITTEGEKNSLYTDNLLGGATLIMFHSETGRQILSCMIITNDGSIIMVDGGFGEDADYLTSQIVARGGHVSAWLITHPHADHVGALYTILQNEDARYAQGLPAQITIDGIYYALGDESWYAQNDPDELTMASAIIGEFSGVSDSILHPVHLGDTFQVDTAIIQVLNDRYDQASSKQGNNAGIVYKVTINGVSILFLGDIAQEGVDHMLAYIDASVLDSDIVQMTHHGQADVNEDFYRLISPVICLWPTPDYIWFDQGSSFTVVQTKQWMIDLGVQRNYCMKDGDQIIR